MVDELYAYFLELAPTHFFQSPSLSSHVSLRVTLLLKMWKIVTKTFFWRSCDSRAHLNSCLATCNGRRTAIHLVKQIFLFLS